jgi:nucleotide-binding universal stress UspA family protein
MHKIIVPLDGSELSERAIGLGGAFARASAGRLELVHVLEEPIAFDLLPSLVIPDRSAAERYLQRVAERLSSDLEVTSYVIRGQPVSELLKLTHDDPEAVLVMSTHGRGGLGRLMLGSVADKVLRAASVPVALVRGNAPPHHGDFRSLLVALDDSSFAEAALPLAINLAQGCGATLSLVRVCEPFWNAQYSATAAELAYLSDTQLVDLERECLDGARRYLDLIAGEIRAKGVRVIWEVRSGRAADEIIRAAETTESDLIIMSTHGRGGIRRLAMGSVTNEVLHRGITPLLAISPKVIEHEQAEVAEMLSTL